MTASLPTTGSAIAPVPNAADALPSARRTLTIEGQALVTLAERLDASFEQAVEILLACKGRVVVSGIGKSGHIARKIAATLASTGSPAFFVHAAEAVHGDLGMITSDDVMLAISYSGTTAELLTIVPAIKRMDAKLISITGNPQSELAKLSDVHLNGGVDIEACPLNLAPTASTTAALGLGDALAVACLEARGFGPEDFARSHPGGALAVACLEARGFGPEDFARSHPGGALGRRLLTPVRDVMRTGDAIPVVSIDASITAALLEITRKGMGMTAVLDGSTLVGIFTDGDLRRLIEREGDIRSLTVATGMTRSPRHIGPDALAVEAAAQMDENRKNQLLVLDDSGRLVGALHTHDLMAAKVL